MYATFLKSGFDILFTEGNAAIDPNLASNHNQKAPNVSGLSTEESRV